MKNLILKKCNKCGALVKIINDCNCKDCGIECCNEQMKLVKENSVDASFEKHIPKYEVKDNRLIVSVDHVMDDDHYIEWICLVNDDIEEYRYLKPGSSTKVEFENTKGTLYSYCNKHGLWKSDID